MTKLVPTPIHNHSMYSALDGWSRPTEMVKRAQDIGAFACGCTDHGNVSAHLEFFKAAKDVGIRPLLGCEIYHGLNTTPDKKRDQAHLIAVAQTDEGLKNLWRLMNQTGRNDHFHHVGRVFWEDLEKYHEGIIFTSACALGLVPREIVQGNYESLNRYLNIFKDNFYIEISTYPASKNFIDEGNEDGFNMQIYNEALVAIAQERGIPMVYGDDGHYSDPSMFEFHDAYLARQTGQTIYTPIEERKMYHPPNAVVIKDMDMIYENLAYLSKSVIDECIDNAAKIAESVIAQLPEIHRHLPSYQPKTSPWVNDEQKLQTPEELFIDLVTEGIEQRYPNADEKVWERVFYEVNTLIRDGIHHYFLMGWDEMHIADALNIERGPGRGSSGGSIVAYALGITDVDPLHYGLIFERFWNSGRVDGFPDIDSDFSRARRDEMIQAVKDRWGHDKVVAIGTTIYLKPKAVIDKMASTCGISREEAEELKDIVGRTTKIDILGHEQIGWSEELEPGKKYYVEQDVGENIEKWILDGDDSLIKNKQGCDTDGRRYFVELCRATCSRVSQFGIHASGIVISDVDTDAELPAQIRGGKSGIPATMWPMTDVDKRQFVKLDILGLRTLDVLEFWKQDMSTKYNIDILWSGLDLEEYPDAMWKLLHDGFTAGIFQVEDGYGRQLCKKMKPISVMDLAVIGALNRPGPIQAGIPDEYIARKNGEKPVTYPHLVFRTLMEKHLQSTYGLWVFQEQIINYFNELGYSPGDADAIRKIMGKKKPEHMNAVRDGLEEWENKGYLSMAVAAGIPLNIAEDIWSDIEGFADYCFNLAHSVEYGVISFRTLYAKYYGPPEFFAAVIRSLDPSTDGTKRKEMLPILINECHRFDIGVLPPDIQHSQAYTYAEDGNVYFGFGDIAGVRSSGPFVVELRDQIGLDISSFEAFELSFDSYNKQWNADKKSGKLIISEGIKPRSPKQQLTANKITALNEVGCWNNITGTNRSLREQQKSEEKLLEVILTDDSLEIIEANMDKISLCDSYEDVLENWSNKAINPEDSNEYIDYEVPGVISNIVEKTARKSGKPFGILTIVYESSELTFMVWADMWKRVKPSFKMRTVGIFDIRQGPDNQYGPSYTFKSGMKLN